MSTLISLSTLQGNWKNYDGISVSTAILTHKSAFELFLCKSEMLPYMCYVNNTT
jgi:hypothetical protein